MGTDYAFPGFPLATVVLADRVSAYYTCILSQGAGTTIEIGELSGGSLSALRGGPTGGRTSPIASAGRRLPAVKSSSPHHRRTGGGQHHQS